MEKEKMEDEPTKEEFVCYFCNCERNIGASTLVYTKKCINRVFVHVQQNYIGGLEKNETGKNATNKHFFIRKNDKRSKGKWNNYVSYM